MAEPAPFEVLDPEPLRSPTLIAGYGGWSDAGEAASTAVRYLFESFSAPLYARIDTEDFLDFTVVRPQVRIEEGARHPGGVNIFGRGFGNHDQDIVMRLHLKRKPA